MKIPETPPEFKKLIDRSILDNRLSTILSTILSTLSKSGGGSDYLHWDKLKFKPAPGGLSHEEWWLRVKMTRLSSSREIPLRDKRGNPFRFNVPDFVQEALHKIDQGAGGYVGMPSAVSNPHIRDRYILSSLLEEAITSSQLEGAVTTRDVAKEMIRSGREPIDNSERMILNNYVTMKEIRKLKTEDLSPQLVFRIHRLVTDKTLNDASAAGRFRKATEDVVVGDDYGAVYHVPPSAAELPDRLENMCGFANGLDGRGFVHPVVRAILLHFWLAYDHPFVDGNGRTARALFYWAMLRYGFWLVEFISISTVIRKAPSKYGRSFLHTETDDNDLTYFLIGQITVIQKAISELHQYIERKTLETKQVESEIKALHLFNHRQTEIIRHALKHPGHRYTFESHRRSHNTAYQTARTDLLDLHREGLLEKKKRGKEWGFFAPEDLSGRLKRLS